MPNINGLTLISNITGDSKDKKSDLYPADLKEIAVYVTNTDANPVKVSFASDQGSERAWKRMLSDTFSAKDKSKETARKIKKTQVSPADLMEAEGEASSMFSGVKFLEHVPLDAPEINEEGPKSKKKD